MLWLWIRKAWLSLIGQPGTSVTDGATAAHHSPMRPRSPIRKKPPLERRGRPQSLGCQKLLNPADACSIKGCKDFRFGLFAEVLQGLADRGMVKHATMDKPKLQGDGAFHMGTTVVDGTGDRKETFEDPAGFRIVLRLSCLDPVSYTHLTLPTICSV